MRALCVSIHDVSPATWASCRELVAAVEAIDPGLPLTLLVVPDYHGRGDGVPAGYRAWLDARVSRGDEIALHGYTHRDDAPARAALTDVLRRRVYTAGEGEFASISRDTAFAKLAAGEDWCVARGWRPRGFVAPAWLMSPGAWQALCAFDFTYTTTLGRLHLLREGRAIRALSLVYSARTPLRRWSSCAWNEALSIGLRDAPLVRVGLHPADVKHPALSVHIQRMVDRVRRGRIALTKGDYAARGRRL